MQRNDSVIKILSDLVAIDSQTYKGNYAIIAHLSDVFKDYQQVRQAWVREQDDVRGENLIVKIPGKSAKRSFVFICHTDTVPTSSAWETDPFILEENGGNLYGLGACDTKGGIAALIEAVLTLSEKPAYDTYLVFDGDEEEHFTGAKKYLKSFNLQNPVFLAIEPTDQNLVTAARSILSFTVVTHGKAQHASFGTPEFNREKSAIYKMHAIMDVLMQDARRLATEQDELLGSNAQNFGMITGGTGGNVLPESCMLTVDRRLLPEKDLETEVKRLTTLIKSVDPRSEITNVFMEKGFATSDMSAFAHGLLRTLKGFYPSASCTCFTAMSEVSLFQNLGDAVVVGPGSITKAHQANEYVGAQELFTFVHVFQKILQEVEW